jgi:hypothetical protein
MLTPKDVKRTSGVWDKDVSPVYFQAQKPPQPLVNKGLFKFVLVALNNIRGEKDMEDLIRETKEDNLVLFIDSGVFNLAATHAKLHNIPLSTALDLPPNEVDGFDDLMVRYKAMIKRLDGLMWGYVEIDQGDTNQKRINRKQLEDEGYRPIPVFHALTDPMEYFDELASQYDRICFANLVEASPSLRRKLLQFIWEKKKQYPHLWVHGLGLTPSAMTNAYPMDSCDSSAWISAIRWPTWQLRSANVPFGYMPEAFRYDQRKEDKIDDIYYNYRTLCMQSYFNTLNMTRFTKDLEAVGLEPIQHPTFYGEA